MVYSDTSTKLGLIQDCEQLVFGNYGDISSSSDRLYDFTARINRAYDKLATLIMGSDGRWQFDDTNYTDLPIGSTTITSGQQDYAFDVEYMDILKVVLLDSAGNRKVLDPIDINDPLGKTYLEAPSTVTGVPQWYDKSGASIFLYPIPNYTKSAALIVYYQRKPSYFAFGDMIKAVGVPAVFHRYLSLEASSDYAITKGLTNKNDLAERVLAMEETISDFYSKRSKDEQKFIRPVSRSYR